MTMPTVAPITIAISMHVRCAACQSTIHLGAIVDRARCPKCGKIEPLPPKRWQAFLDAACNDGPSLPHGEAQLRFDDDNAWVIATAHAPKCAACGQVFPPSSAQNARVNGRCFCVGCGAKIGVRPVPKELAPMLPCITHLLNEDGTQLKTPDAPIPDPTQVVSVKCPDCGGNIHPDGRSRAVRCPYCSILVVLPQAVWARLHTGKNEPHTFYLVHDPTLPRPLGRADVEWGSLYDLCCDAYGNVYGLAESDGGFNDDTYMLFALDNQLKTKWITKGLKVDDEAKVLWRNDGVLFVWSPRRYSALLYRAGDGVEIGKLGGEQPKNAEQFSLDLSRAYAVGIDHDGTILISKRERLVRCAPDGSAQPTWPPGQGLFGGILADKLRPFPEGNIEDSVHLEAVGNQPTKIYDPEIRIGWDGRTYLQKSGRVVCFDRMGKKLYEVQLPENAKNVQSYGVDARGIVYLLCYAESYTQNIHRIIGGKFSPFIDGLNPATPIREERRFTVHPDGTMFLGAYRRQIRIFAPDGRLLYLSPKAREEDERNAERKARERDADRVR